MPDAITRRRQLHNVARGVGRVLRRHGLHHALLGGLRHEPERHRAGQALATAAIGSFVAGTVATVVLAVVAAPLLGPRLRWVAFALAAVVAVGAAAAMYYLVWEPAVGTGALMSLVGVSAALAIAAAGVSFM